MGPLPALPRGRPLPRPTRGAAAPPPVRQALGRARVRPDGKVTPVLSRLGSAFQGPRAPPHFRPRAGSDGAQDGPSPSGAPPPPDDATVADVVTQLQRLKSALGALSAAASDATAAAEALSVALQGGALPPPGTLPPMSPTGAYFGSLSGLPLGLPVTGGTPQPGPALASELGTGLEEASTRGEGARGEEAGGKGEGEGATGQDSPNELAMRLQQAFVQARVEGLGRPPEVSR